MIDTMKERPLLIIKLGGSIITEDSDFMTPREDLISNLLLLLSEFVNEYHYIIVHGAGSFGHPLAKSYKLSKGFKNFNQYNGIWLTHKAMVDLNSLLIDLGREIGLNLLSFPPLASVTTNSGRINNWDIQALEIAIDQNFIPVTFGDVVFDIAQQFSILSGDQIVPFLASKLGVSKIIMLTDVEGVYSKNPKLDSSAHLFNEIDITDNKLMEKIFSIENDFSDKVRVTGEMGRKLDELIPILKKGIETFIISGLETKFLRSHLENQKPLLGTKLIAK